MTDSSYPRDMVGYGRNRPHPRWPGEARIAVQFVINYEEGAENTVLHGDAGSETLLTEFGFAEPRIGERALPIESMYEFGSRVGFWRLHRLFTGRGVPVTIFGVAMALARNPDAVAAMVEADWEIASHGYRWIDYHAVPEAEERAHIGKVIAIQQELTGTRPLGYFLGRRSPNTVRLVAEEGGFLYSQDSYADELPYWVEEAGRPLLMIPYTADHNDHRFATAPGFDWGEPFFAYLRDAFDVLYEEGSGAARHDEHRLAQPAGRPARPLRRAQALRRPRAGPRPGLALPRHRHRPPLAGAGGRGLASHSLRTMVRCMARSACAMIAAWNVSSNGLRQSGAGWPDAFLTSWRGLSRPSTLPVTLRRAWRREIPGSPPDLIRGPGMTM